MGRSRVGRLIVVLFLMVMGTNCTYLREAIGLGIQRPKISLLSITASKISLTSVELIVQLRIDNPNGYDLEFRGVNYQLTSQNLGLASGSFAPLIKIPEESNAVVKLPLKIEAANAMKVFRDIFTGANPETVFNLNVSSIFESPIGPIDVEFTDHKTMHGLEIK